MVKLQISHLSLVRLSFAREKTPKSPAQIRRPFTAEVLLAAAPRDSAPPPSVSGPKIPLFVASLCFPEFHSIYCFLWMETVMPVAAPEAPRSVLVSGVFAGSCACSDGAARFEQFGFLVQWFLWVLGLFRVEMARKHAVQFAVNVFDRYSN